MSNPTPLSGFALSGLALSGFALSGLARIGSGLRNRAAGTVRRHPLLRTVHDRHRPAPADHSAAQPSPRTVTAADHAELRALLTAVRHAAALWNLDDPNGWVPEVTDDLGADGQDDRDRLRRLAVACRREDPDGSVIAALSLLAGQFDDPAARAWLPVALAEAGRFSEAAQFDLAFAPGRPAARGYAVLITALQQLGQDEQAADRMRQLENRFPGLPTEFTHIWGDDRLAAAYRRLHADAERRRYADADSRAAVLPVFQHLPFCGGTSMQYSLGLVVPAARTLQLSRRWGLVQIQQAGRLTRPAVDDLMMVHQHHPFALDLPGRRLRHFTVLRDPVSQVRSGYYKRSARDKIISTRDTDSADFTAHAEYTLANGLTNLLTRMIITTHPALRGAYRRRFSSPGSFTMISYEEEMFWLEATRGFTEDRLLELARETLDENFSVVGTMAHLPASHLACTAAVGVPLAHRLGHRGRSGQPHDPVTDAMARRLRTANSVDQQLYEEYTARFEVDHADLIAATEAPAGSGSVAEAGEEIGNRLAVAQ